MASRTVVRAGRSPHSPRARAAAAAPARAALPHSHSSLHPPRCDSSSPMPLFLLSLLILLLLLEDAGAQQGEWSPGNARRVEPRDGGGAGRVCGAPGPRAFRRICDAPGACGALPCVGRPGRALERLSGKGGISLLSPNLARLYFFGRAIHFPEKRE